MATELTEHFTLEELVASITAEEKHIDNTPPQEVIGRLRLLAIRLLEPLRLAWGSGIRVTSGYRCEKLNKLKGGSSTSAHCLGWAADLYPINGKIHEFKSFTLRWLKDNNIQFDQYINEFSNTSQWVHLSLYNRSMQQRREFLKYQNGVYTKIH